MRNKRILHESNDTLWRINDVYTQLYVSETIWFTLPPNYPFVPPQLWVDGLPYTEVVYTQYTKIKHLEPRAWRPLLQDWSPCYTCYQVYTQYTEYMNLLKSIELLEELPFDNLIMKNVATFLL